MNGFDCNCKLSYEKALQMKNYGFEFAIRYVGRLKQTSLDIDKTEVDNILKAGLKLAIVQHCPWPGWFPDKSLGAEYGKNASEYAHDSGIKAGTSLYLDLEGIKPGAPKQNIIDFCNAWYDEVLAGGYIPGVYVGFDIFLTSYELYHELKFQHYWKSLSKVPDVDQRGYEMVQKSSPPVNDIDIDINTVIGDSMGNAPVFMFQEKALTHTIKVYSDGSCTVE